MKIDFSQEEKDKVIELIEERYYSRNFGTMAKADWETMLFHIFFEHLLNNNQPFDDYTVSKALGISQTRVRNLKQRQELQYPRGNDWKEDFVKEIVKATYEDETRTVSMVIPEVTMQTELRYFMEKNGWYDEYPPNPRLFRCRLDFFVKLCEALEDEEVYLTDEAEQRLRTIRREGKEENALQKIINGSVEEGLKELAKEGSKAIVAEVIGMIPFGGVAKQAFTALVEVLKR